SLFSFLCINIVNLILPSVSIEVYNLRQDPVLFPILTFDPGCDLVLCLRDIVVVSRNSSAQRGRATKPKISMSLPFPWFADPQRQSCCILLELGHQHSAPHDLLW
ncbi:hypothetical protein EGW08_007300, partial [Elysia chlorotica]